MRSRYTTEKGYVMVYAPGHPVAGKNGYAREHRLVWHDANGPIPLGFHLHHKNEVKDDNRLENLELVTPLQHNQHHQQWRKAQAAKSPATWINFICPICEKPFKRRESYVRHQEKWKKEGFLFFCSLRCSSKHGRASQNGMNFPRAAGRLTAIVAAAKKLGMIGPKDKSADLQAVLERMVETGSSVGMQTRPAIRSESKATHSLASSLTDGVRTGEHDRPCKLHAGVAPRLPFPPIQEG